MNKNIFSIILYVIELGKYSTHIFTFYYDRVCNSYLFFLISAYFLFIKFLGILLCNTANLKFLWVFHLIFDLLNLCMCSPFFYDMLIKFSSKIKLTFMLLIVCRNYWKFNRGIVFSQFSIYLLFINHKSNYWYTYMYVCISIYSHL